MTDARFDPATENPGFTPLGKRLMWKDDAGQEHWSQLYQPSDYAKDWDEAEWATHAIGIRNLHRPDQPAFAYCIIRMTGRRDRTVPGTGGPSVGCIGRKALVTMNKGTMDESEFDCWVIPNENLA